MKLKSIIALLLVLCMAFALCACGGSEDSGKETEGQTDSQTEEQTEAQADVTYNEGTKPHVGEYVVTVVDENGDPVEGVKLKFNKDSGDTTITTNDSGTTTLTCLVTDIVVTVEEVPEAYQADSEEKSEKGKSN